MTAESRCYLSFEDILAVQLGCSHCGGRLLLSVDRIDRHPDKCPNCHEDWFRDAEQKARFYNCLDSFAQMRKLAKEMESAAGKGMKPNLEIKVT